MICEPYRSCSLLGALRIFSNIKNVVSLIHGPTGCSFYARNSIIRLNGYYSTRKRIPVPLIYSTDFNEDDTIFGGITKLRNAAEEIIIKDHPEVLFIFNCCVSEIIGEDIDGVCEDLELKYGIPVVPVHTAGFKGDHKTGMRMGNEILFHRFIKNEPISKKTDVQRVNLLGDYDYFNRSSVEIIEMINKIPNTEVVSLPGACSIDDIKSASSAVLNVITCQNASKYLANLMCNEFNIPFVGDDVSFFGLDNCFRTYSEIYDFLSADKTELTETYNRYKAQLNEYIPFFKGKRAAIVSGTRRAKGYACVLRELGIKIDFIFTESSAVSPKDEIMQYSTRVMCDEYPAQLFNTIDEIKPNYLFATIPEIISPNRYVDRNDEDHTGFVGTIRMAEYLKRVTLNGEETLFVKTEE